MLNTELSKRAIEALHKKIVYAAIDGRRLWQLWTDQFDNRT